MIKGPASVGRHSAAQLPASPLSDLPRWRSRLEELWRQQVQQIIELSLAYHDASSARHAEGSPERPGAGSGQLQPILARAASAHQVLAEIEAALGRIDTGWYGICQQCGGRLPDSLLEARPQLRFCWVCQDAVSAGGGTRPARPVSVS